MDKRLFSIGEMARLFQLSVSSIRHYEALGLLTPEYVDPATSYRYYGPRQFEVFNTIRYLRALDMPLEEIADFLHNRDVDKIEEKLRVQKEAVAQKQRHLARIERKIDAQLQRLHDAQVSPLGRIELIQTPACRLFWVEDSLSMQSNDEIELSTSRLAAAQAEAVIFLGKVASASPGSICRRSATSTTTAYSSCWTRPTASTATPCASPPPPVYGYASVAIISNPQSSTGA